MDSLNIQCPDKATRALILELKGRSHGDSVVSCLRDRSILTKPVLQRVLDHRRGCKEVSYGKKRKRYPRTWLDVTVEVNIALRSPSRVITTSYCTNKLVASYSDTRWLFLSKRTKGFTISNIVNIIVIILYIMI